MNSRSLQSSRCVPGIALAAGIGLTIAPAAAQCAAPWQTFGAGMDTTVHVLAVHPNGDLIAGGLFTTAGGVAASSIARWDGTAWSALGQGVYAGVNALATLSNGDLVVGGDFILAGGVLRQGIARWNGTTWSGLGPGMNGSVNALVVLPNGDLVAGGTFTTAGTAAAAGVALWNGSSWSAVGSGFSGWVHALAVLANGDLVAGGVFLSLGGVGANGIARWDGNGWSTLGTGMGGAFFPTVHSLAVQPGGGLIAGGDFGTAGATSANNIARWNGVAWERLGSGVDASVFALTVLPDGVLVAGGGFYSAGGMNVSHLARWNGMAWSAVGAGANDDVQALTMLPGGDLALGGNFTAIGGSSAGAIARLTTSCLATTEVYGAGCMGGAGPLNLAVRQLPRIGGTFEALATTLPITAFPIGAYSFQPLALPMPAVHPLGMPGCTLLVGDDILLLFPSSGGSALTSLAIPGALALVGATFYHQVVLVERAGVGEIAALTSTNALRATIGAL